VGTRIHSVQEDRFVMDYAVVSHGQHTVTTEGKGVIVSFNYREGKKAPLPEEIRRKIEEMTPAS
jgi:acyl-CoA thioesterase FadM